MTAERFAESQVSLRHPMARPWDPCRYIATDESLPEALGNGVKCRIKSGNDARGHESGQVGAHRSRIGAGACPG
ncbi:hypothetical protein [Roseibium limicola]|uniref:hypothetical protein n=1 Tax=Roseibium limicola TaxID=2816037 RepID=UPI001A8E9062|nr:hypothetical protein [Roseibium limicola]